MVFKCILENQLIGLSPVTLTSKLSLFIYTEGQVRGTLPVVEGSAAGNRQFAGTAETGTEGMQPAGRASRMLAAEVAAVGRETVPVAGSRGAGSGGAAGSWIAGRGMELGTADVEAEMAAGSMEAERTGAVVVATVAAVDM